MVAVAGLDLSLTNSGVAIIKEDESVECFSFGYSLHGDISDRDRVERVISITNGILGLLKSNNVKYVGIENYAFKGHGLTLLAELTGNLKVQCYVGLKSIPIMLAATCVRKYLLGKSTKDKKVVRKYLSDHGYDQPKNLDESDALAIALMVNDWSNRRSFIVDGERMRTLDRIDFHQSRTATKK